MYGSRACTGGRKHDKAGDRGFPLYFPRGSTFCSFRRLKTILYCNHAVPCGLVCTQGSQKRFRQVGRSFGNFRLAELFSAPNASKCICYISKTASSLKNCSANASCRRVAEHLPNAKNVHFMYWQYIKHTVFTITQHYMYTVCITVRQVGKYNVMIFILS